MVYIVQHFLAESPQGDLVTNPNADIRSQGGKFSIVCGLPRELLGATVPTEKAGEMLTHTGTNYHAAVNCKKCKATDAYQTALGGVAGSGRAEDYLERPGEAAA